MCCFSFSNNSSPLKLKSLIKLLKYGSYNNIHSKMFKDKFGNKDPHYDGPSSHNIDATKDLDNPKDEVVA